MSSKMPGNLNGISNSNEISKLTPYGIINIDLQTTKGEKLILQPGKQIKLSLLIPPTLVFNTPSSISMWYFNDSLGYWIEEGKSVLTGNTYQGNIKHTGCWCYASSKPSVNIFGRLTDQFGIPLSSELKITKSHEEIGTYIHTNIDGSFSSPVNKDEYFTIYTYFQASGGNLYYKVYSFGPYIKDIAIEPMQINFYDPGTYSFKATFKDCKDNLIQNGYVKIIQGTDSHYFQIINGQVEASFRTFDINVSSIITALNLDNFTETIPVNLIGSGLHDLGVVIIC
ncbi:MAG TPA: hypothetical protein VK590_10840, partial [Saprospiraceae bacterium]|nr:hypothetical protein [Saprospiraceae bacterium]